MPVLHRIHLSLRPWASVRLVSQAPAKSAWVLTFWLPLSFFPLVLPACTVT
jgi:hypothetical protein